MDTGLDFVFYNIIEPWTDSDNDVAHYLYDLGVNFNMRGSDTYSNPNPCVIYTTKITGLDALRIKIVFPNISIKLCAVPEKVSTLARRVLGSERINCCVNNVGSVEGF